MKSSYVAACVFVTLDLMESNTILKQHVPVIVYRITTISLVRNHGVGRHGIRISINFHFAKKKPAKHFDSLGEIIFIMQFTSSVDLT